MRRLLFLLPLLLACAEQRPLIVEQRPLPPRPDEIELVESWPAETSLDHPSIRDAAVVWPEMIDHAQSTILFEEFYASDVEDGAADSPLAPTIAAIERAVKRGVVVRFLADHVMAPKYPATLERLKKAGAQVRIIDCKPRYGGVQHAKFFVVDEVEAFVGSQNFDWRALRHIQEMGVRVRSRAIAGGLVDIFQTDWELADPATPATKRVHAFRDAPATPTFSLHASPAEWLPDPSIADLARITALLDSAKTSIDLQVLTYSTKMRDKSEWRKLDDALRSAAARGVHVRLIVSSWSDKEGSHEQRSIRELAAVPNIEVRVMTIPPASTGDIPFARVTHAKFFLADRRTAWIGTSNWEGDYFLKTRNVAIVTTAPNVVAPLGGVFDDDWTFSARGAVARSSSSGPAPQ